MPLTQGCGWLDTEDVMCGATPTSKVIVRGHMMSGVVSVCAKHKAEHNRIAASTRLNKSKKPSTAKR